MRVKQCVSATTVNKWKNVRQSYTIDRAIGLLRVASYSNKPLIVMKTIRRIRYDLECEMLW